MDTATIKTPTVSGTPFGGGFYAGRIRINDDIFAIIVAPKATEIEMPWNESSRSIPATSFFDGAANTKAMAMAQAGSDLAQHIQGLDINGFSDWYLPSRDELELCYRNLKPSAHQNYCYRGDNPSSVPPGYAYARDLPAQTNDAAFQDGGEEAFELAWYWTSTQGAGNPDYAWVQLFDDGGQFTSYKSNTYRARAVRRLLVIE
ncbi:DUF1566 domain-containing protein [Undibacterium sp. Ji50W]|uniref:Lcl C-terminal domain-containing protein n=1 Tax=Undibacterium sp. Ji50W TaxID=3413041 RepID=UPI003BF3CDC0